MKKLIPMVAVTFLGLSVAGISYATDVEDAKQELVEKQQEVSGKQKELKQEMRKEAIELNKDANKSMQQVSRISKIIGTEVKDSYGTTLGDIKDMVINPESGQVVYTVVSFGGVLGVGDKLFALPWKTLKWNQDKKNYVLDIDKAVLKNAPGFDSNHWPDSTDKWDQIREELYQFYHVKP
jgi:sporulation protein YlmC with PRC-barrel domain